MNLNEETKKYGAKGAVLKYIQEKDSSIPIPPFLNVAVNDDWKKYQTEINNLGKNVLVRSSSPLEDGHKLSFAGLFATEKYWGKESVEKVFESMKEEYVLDYIKNNNVTEELKMGLVFQKEANAQFNWGILRHPHRPELFFVMGRPQSNQHTSLDYIYDEKKNELYEINDFSGLYCWRKELENIDLDRSYLEDLPEILKTYKKIEQMPEFKKTGYAYHMEFGTDPFSVYQFRPFKKKEIANWDLKSLTLPESDEENDYNETKYNICFGITPREGLEFTFVKALCAHHKDKEINYAKEKLCGLPKEKGLKKLLKKMKYLNKYEKAYAEEILKLHPDSGGADAFDNAKSKLNVQFKDQDVCLFQEKMHFHYGKDIDLTFPDAKVWIPSGGLQFLSHDWFRAMQHYDLVLAAYSEPFFETGDKVRIYSDGRTADIRRA